MTSPELIVKMFKILRILNDHTSVGESKQSDKYFVYPYHFSKKGDSKLKKKLNKANISTEQ